MKGGDSDGYSLIVVLFSFVGSHMWAVDVMWSVDVDTLWAVVLPWWLCASFCGQSASLVGNMCCVWVSARKSGPVRFFGPKK